MAALLDRADVVELDVARPARDVRRPGGATVAGATTTPGRCPRREPCSQSSSSSGLPTVADRPIRWIGPAGEPGEPFQDGEQVPAAVVAGEGVHLVDDDGPQVGEEPPVVDRRR